jgi:hypothetical protein
MKAIALTAPDAPPALSELPEPTPGPNEVLVRVHASSINPADNGIASGMLKQMGIEYEYPVTLGRDYVGVVEQVGSQVTRYAVGDEVFGFLLHANPTVRDGSWAELIAVPEDMFIGRAPQGLDLATAGAAPLAGIAAIMAIDALELSEGDTVLIVGATGGVGSLAVQLAARAGATVVAPGLPDDEAPTCAGWASASCCPATGTSPPPPGSATSTASTPSSTWSTTHRAFPRPSSRTAAASPPPPGPPAKVPDGRWSSPRPRPKTSSAWRAYSPTARCACPSRRRTTSHRRPTRSLRCPRRIPGASSRSASRKRRPQ